MRRTYFSTAAALALVAVLMSSASAATKTYQYTGVVKSIDANVMVVEKNTTEAPWTFETSKDTKGAPKVGDKVTIMYKMVATDIQIKPAK